MFYRGDQVPQLIGGFDQTFLDKVHMVREAADKPAEDALAGDVVSEPAECSEFSAPAEALQELVVVANLEDELGEDGPPHGFDRVSGASGVAVGLKCVDDGLVVQSV